MPVNQQNSKNLTQEVDIRWRLPGERQGGRGDEEGGRGRGESQDGGVPAEREGEGDCREIEREMFGR